MSGFCRGVFLAAVFASFLALPAAAQQKSTAPSASSPGSSAGSTSKGATTSGAGTSASATQFTTAAQAKGHCPGDTVVWGNLNSKVYHYSGSRDYGTTKSGAYMCEKDTAAAGFHAAKNEQHP